MEDLSEVTNYLKDNTFIITIQPKQNFHYRYETELKNSHGYLTGQRLKPHVYITNTPTSNDVYPSVKLVLPKDCHLDDFNNKRDFYILCSIHNNVDKCLSPHLLLAKGETKVNYKFIFEKMSESVDDLERYWELKEYVIVRLKTEEFKKSFAAKDKEYQKLQLPIEFRSLLGNLNLNDEKIVKYSGNLNVCLGFTVFEKDFYTNTYRLYKETIFSNNIYHGDDIKIHHLCNTKGSILGGTKITILIKLTSNFPLNVLITKINEETKKTDWSTEIPIMNENIFGKHAITFILPAYNGPKCKDDEIEVNMEVVVAGTTYKSQHVKFYYLNNNDDNRPRKKARNSREEELPVEVSSSTSSLNNDTTIYFTHLHDLNLQSEDFMVTPLAIPSITNYVPNPDLDITSIVNYMETNDFSDNSNFNNLIYSNEYFDSNDQFEYISRDRVAPQHEEIRENDKDKILPLQHEVLKTSLKMKTLILPQPIDPNLKIKQKIDEILKMSSDAKDIDIMGFENKDGNTIFHEALSSSEAFVYLYKMTKESPHQNLVLKARNKNRETLLHYACKQNKATCIRPLIGMGCCAHEQDTNGRTPLHIAMEYNHTDCVLKFQQLLQDHSKYPKEVKDSFIKMFKVYNHNGHTVLHVAVLEKRFELVDIMLEFCQKYEINVLDYEVLGDGDSIAHLVVKNDLIEMIKLIQKYIPNYLTIENYPGVSVVDLPVSGNVSKEMLQALNVK